jgi:hypothetical protein
MDRRTLGKQFAATVTLALMGPVTVWACSCVRPDIVEATVSNFHNSDLVAEVTVIREKRDRQLQTATYRVDKVIKGDQAPGDIFTTRGSTNAGMCGRTVHADVQYLYYGLETENGTFSAPGSCSWTKRLAQVSKEERDTLDQVQSGTIAAAGQFGRASPAMVSVLSNPDNYLGASITLFGFYHGTSETVPALFLSRDHAIHLDHASSIAVQNVTHQNRSLYDQCGGHYVRIHGRLKEVDALSARLERILIIEAPTFAMISKEDGSSQQCWPPLLHH